MVSDPVVTVLAMEDPLIEPNMAEASTATFAGPPGYRPAMMLARSMKNWPRPILVAITPNSTKWKTKVATTLAG
jgi:hypothetical protein